MTTIVTITTTAPIEIVSERIAEDGRERFENGRDPIAANSSQDFIVHEGQSLRVVVAVPEADMTDPT